MMALVSPGVEVQVIDESFYTPAAPGTVPMIFVASAEDKTNSAGTAVAAGTTKANAGKPYLLTSQKDLGDLFGDPTFYSDANGNMIHGGELNEYGLQAAYSLLGITNQVYVARADFDLGKLEASATAPAGKPTDGASWFDTTNTVFGLLEWNGNAVNTTGGQSFSSVTPLVITEAADTATGSNPLAPSAAVGAVGDYAVVTLNTSNNVWYKKTGGTWVQVGSVAWETAWPTVSSITPVGSFAGGETLLINSTTITASGTTLADLVSDINGAAITGVTASLVSGKLYLYADRTANTNDGTVVIAAGTMDLAAAGLAAGTYAVPAVATAAHTSVPEWKSSDTSPRPTGSVWLKTTNPNGGANFSVKKYSIDTGLWSSVSAPLYASNATATYWLDKTGGGANLTLGDVYVKVNATEATRPIVDYKIFARAGNGAATATSPVITASTFTVQAYDFTVSETVKNSAAYSTPVSVAFTATGATTDATLMAGEINAAGLTNVTASVTADNKVVITHALGGEIKLVDGTNTPLAAAGFAVYDAADATTTTNFYADPDGTVNGYVVSLWKVLSYSASVSAPSTLTADGEIWYSSVIDEIDIMVHDGADWKGYANEFATTDPAGPIVSATAPTEQSDGTALVDNDLWISTADLENFPTVYRWNATLSSWAVVDKTDQTTENGMLFADARWSTTGGTATAHTAGDIVDMLSSDYLDADAPDPALYPKGMLLWNLRRSGFNVKRFERNYVDTGETNPRQSDASMANYYPHRWVTDSSNQPDGSGTFGRHAQRKSVVQALQAMVNSNQDIRDDETRVFNIMATPGYPELIGEMVTLNYDRKLTAFVVGDTPFRLTPDATSLNNWATNVALAVEDNDDGAVSKDEYLGMYYPSGFTSDNAGNNVVVPASHMALRTIVLNDQVAYPWYAPAGSRRGGVSNASAAGYINAEGEFVSIALNAGQRDVLYSNSINPITPVAGAGLLVFGQKTRARSASALDRVNVARLTVYLRRQLEILARPYLFEPNDAATRSQVKAAADALLLELVNLRALYDFVTVCDTTNNTTARIDRNELYLDIAIEPVKSIEFIYIPLRIKNTGEIAALG
jgi:hypothetical protein